MKKLALLTAVLLLGMRTPARADNPPATKLTHQPNLLGVPLSNRIEPPPGWVADQTESIEIQAGSEDLEEGDYERAEAHFQKALAIQPTSLRNVEHLAYALVGLHKSAQALRLLHNAYYQNGHNLYTSGMDWRAYMTYALLEIEAGNWNEAALAYDLAGNTGFKYKSFGYLPVINVLFKPDHPQPNLLVAAANIVLGQLSWGKALNYTGNAAYDHAISHMKIAVNFASQWDIAWFYYGYMLQAGGKYNQAVKAFNRTLSLARNDKTIIALTKSEMGLSVCKVAENERKAAAKSNLKK